MVLTLEQRLARKGFTVTQARIVAALYNSAGVILSRDAISVAVFGRNDLEMGVTVAQWLFRARKRLAALGVEILTIHGQGYMLTIEARDLLSVALSRHDESPE